MTDEEKANRQEREREEKANRQERERAEAAKRREEDALRQAAEAARNQKDRDTLLREAEIRRKDQANIRSLASND
jgi:hypothetical protein